MKEKVIKICNLISEEIDKKLFDCKFILSISGGLDSMSLFNILKDYNLNFITIHFNHKINSQSDQISDFVTNQVILSGTRKHFTINLKIKSEKNFESYARYKRYFHLENLRRRIGFDFILTAHHLDDQIETLHMKKEQNTHWSNSIGIREAYRNIRRPFLTVYKNNIRNYAIQKKISWIDDVTNKNNKLIRNKCRNIDLPKLNKINSKYSLSLLEIRKSNKIKFDKIIDIIKKTNFNDTIENIGVSIDLKTFSKFDNVSKRLIIQKYFRDYFNRYDVYKTYKEWQNIFKYLRNMTKRTNIYKICNTLSIYKSETKVYFLKTDELFHDNVLLNNQCNWYKGQIKFNKNESFIKSFNRASVSLPNNSNFIVRQWRHSDSFISATSGSNCKVSDLFINNKLNFLEKLSQPIVTDKKDVILWIPGLAHCKFKKTIKTKNFVWINT